MRDALHSLRLVTADEHINTSVMSQVSLRTYLRFDGRISGAEELIHRRLELAELRLGLGVHRLGADAGERLVRSEACAWR